MTLARWPGGESRVAVTILHLYPVQDALPGDKQTDRQTTAVPSDTCFPSDLLCQSNRRRQRGARKLHLHFDTRQKTTAEQF